MSFPPSSAAQPDMSVFVHRPCFMFIGAAALLACGGGETDADPTPGVGGDQEGPAATGAGGELGGGGDTGTGGDDVGAGGGSIDPGPRVPVTLALADGRITTTCDRGHTIAADTIIAADAHNHHPYAMAGGAAFFDGIFVVATGWGYPGHVLRSEDGLDWEEIDGPRFQWADQTTHAPEGAVVATFHNGTDFVIITGRRRLFSPDGRNWVERGEQLPYEMFHLRSHRFIPELGAHFLRGENAGKDVQWLATSHDGGLTYSMVPANAGYDDRCQARMTYAHGTLMAPGGDGYCRSDDGGASWTYHEAPMKVSTFYPTSTGWVTMGGWSRDMLTSSDGFTWTTTTVASGMRFAAGGFADVGDYYFAASHHNEEFYRSDDGASWTALPGLVSGDVPDARHVFSGWIRPTAACPMLDRQ
ncbi:MAG: hypothetical protein AAGN82_30130 [Myxococcota bacterium]